MKNQVQAVIFDISGTVLDHGSRGPVLAFVELFLRQGVAVSSAEARGAMGLHKRDHIWSMLSLPEIAGRWTAVKGSAPTTDDLDRLYRDFVPLQTQMLRDHCDVIPGVVEVVRELRRRGIKIANTTGFDLAMLDELIPLAASAGYVPDLWVTPDLAGKGRPAPWMAFYAAKQLDLYPMSTFIKVGDTPADIAEAHAACMWAVAVTRTGNEVGLCQRELEALPAPEQKHRIDAARRKLSAGKPHFIIESVADLLPIVHEVNSRLSRGVRP